MGASSPLCPAPIKVSDGLGPSESLIADSSGSVLLSVNLSELSFTELNLDLIFSRIEL